MAARWWARRNGPHKRVLQDEANDVSTISVCGVYQPRVIRVDKLLMPTMQVRE
jgi:hypothetical protein